MTGERALEKMGLLTSKSKKKRVELLTKNKPEIKAGDLFYASWGYDQTNYDYILVLEISKSGKTAKCIRTGFQYLGASQIYNIQKPETKPFGDIFQLKIDGKSLRGSYPFLPNGKGSKRFGTFHKVDRERFYETDSLFGH